MTARSPAGLAIAASAGLLLAACAYQPPLAQHPAGPASEHVRVVSAPDGSTTVYVPVTIEDHGPFNFALDTGASRSLVATTIASELRLSHAGAPQPIQGVGGVERAVPVRVTRWSTGPIKLPPATISAADLPTGRRAGGLEGLLGSDVLHILGSFTLDYRTGTLTINA